MQNTVTLKAKTKARLKRVDRFRANMTTPDSLLNGCAISSACALSRLRFGSGLAFAAAHNLRPWDRQITRLSSDHLEGGWNIPAPFDLLKNVLGEATAVD